METLSETRRLSGALRFFAEIEAFADECVATGLWDDDLTARRRQRIDGRGDDRRSEELGMKAL